MLYGMLGISAFAGIACVPLSALLTWLVAKLIYRKFPYVLSESNQIKRGEDLTLINGPFRL